MSAAINQDFVTYKGDSVTPVFTVLNASGVAVNISTVSQITWTAKLNETAAAALTKTKSGGSITFVTTGADGKFQVAITGTDTSGLTEGPYLHYASITDASANVTTVTIGRMSVGIAPQWTYNPKLITTTPLYQARRLLGDVLVNDQQMLDAELLWYITQYSNVYSAAGAAAQGLAAQFARLVDTVQGEMRTMYSAKARNYAMLASQLVLRGKTSGGATMVYSGAISITDKTNQVQDTDRVPPQFNIGMDDNLLPIGPVGNETPVPQSPDLNGQT